MGWLDEAEKVKKQREQKAKKRFRNYGRVVRPLLNELGKKTWGKRLFLFKLWLLYGDLFDNDPLYMYRWIVAKHHDIPLTFLFMEDEYYMVGLGLDEEQEPAFFVVTARDYVAVCLPTEEDLKERLAKAFQHGPMCGYADQQRALATFRSGEADFPGIVQAEYERYLKGLMKKRGP